MDRKDAGKWQIQLTSITIAHLHSVLAKTKNMWKKIFGPKGDHTTDSPHEIQNNIADGKAMMLDVRSQEERDAGYLKNSIFIPITELKSLPNDIQEISQLDKTKIIYCHCKAGVRARMAANILSPMGYEVRSLPDGFDELVEQGFEPAS